MLKAIQLLQGCVQLYHTMEASGALASSIPACVGKMALKFDLMLSLETHVCTWRQLQCPYQF